MNQRDLSEIKRRLNPDKRNPSLVCGCYVDYIGNPITSFELPVASMDEQENEKYMSIFKKVLSGQIGQTLMPIAYPVEEDDLLLRVRDSALNDEASVQELFTKLIAGIRAEHPDLQSVEQAQTADNWLILLMHDDLDVRRRDGNGEIDLENSDGAFSYVLCAVCPVKQDKSALKYDPADSIFRDRAPEWIAGAPALGFLFPLYEGGAADVNTILFFSKDSNDSHEAFLKAAFNLEAVMPAAEQTENFQALLAQSLGTECSLDVVQEMHEVVSNLLEEQGKDDERSREGGHPPFGQVPGQGKGGHLYLCEHERREEQGGQGWKRRDHAVSQVCPTKAAMRSTAAFLIERPKVRRVPSTSVTSWPW